jgi:hypothetical protein
MTRLQSEWHRLYATSSPNELTQGNEEAPLIDPAGRVRALVLGLARPADWSELSVVWQALQSELGLPAPGIVVSGIDGFELWLSLDEPVPVAQAHAFLESLRARYLSHIAPERITLLPAADPHAPLHARHAARVPALQAHADQWSAFVAPDLAPVFADTPWLDIPPSTEGQAELLSRLKGIKPAAWQAALAQFNRGSSPLPAGAPATTSFDDPKRFLLSVMNNEAAPLALRIEAAKALLPHLPPNR